MDSLNDLKNIWMTANVSTLPRSEDVIHEFKKVRTRQILKKAAVILLSLLLGGVMIYVVFFYRSTLLPTRLGEAFILTAILILIFQNVRSLHKISLLKNYSNSEFIAYMKQVQVDQIQSCERTQLTGFLFSSIGLLLYLFEGLQEHPSLMIPVYALASAWILLNWFVVRPRAIKKKTKQLNKIIEKLEKLSQQL